MIRVVPKFLFFLKGFCLVYLIPMYIPIIQKKRIRRAKKTNGKRATILRLDPSAKESKRIEENIVEINIKIERVRM
jgi:hypothetical protein